MSVLRNGVIKSYPAFDSPKPVSCFTESVASSVRALIWSRRYTPHGVGFHKQAVFDRGGGSVWSCGVTVGARCISACHRKTGA